jgi:hypothetical protein
VRRIKRFGAGKPECRLGLRSQGRGIWESVTGGQPQAIEAAREFEGRYRFRRLVLNAGLIDILVAFGIIWRDRTGARVGCAGW